jgi:hypothetical protein
VTRVISSYFITKKEETSWTLVVVAAQDQAEAAWMCTYSRVCAFPCKKNHKKASACSVLQLPARPTFRKEELQWQNTALRSKAR